MVGVSDGVEELTGDHQLEEEEGEIGILDIASLQYTLYHSYIPFLLFSLSQKTQTRAPSFGWSLNSLSGDLLSVYLCDIVLLMAPYSYGKDDIYW